MKCTYYKCLHTVSIPMIGPVSNDTSAVVMVYTYIQEKTIGFLQIQYILLKYL